MEARSLGNGIPLGLTGFAATTWMLSMVNAGWYDMRNAPLVFALAFAFGGTGQLVASVLEYRRGNTLGTVAFFTYGAFWWSWALYEAFFRAGVTDVFVGWYMAMFAVITLYLWIASFKEGVALNLVLLTLGLTYLALALDGWGAGDFWQAVGGYAGLLSALLAFFTAAAHVINDTFERPLVPK